MGLGTPMIDEFIAGKWNWAGQYPGESSPYFQLAIIVSSRHGRRPAQDDLLARNLDGAQAASAALFVCV
jgi:hypothetical protein